MGDRSRVIAMAITLTCVPATASASMVAATAIVPRELDVVVGGVALVLAIVMLLDVLALRRVASGAAIAEHVSLVMAAVICLAASVLSEWLVRFLPWVDVSMQAQLASDLLVIAAMAFFALYFYRVRSAMVRFLTRFSEEEAFVRAQQGDDPDEIPDEPCDGDHGEAADSGAADG